MRTVQDLGSSHGWHRRRAELPDGRHAFVKTGLVSQVFTSEAAGLRWLGETGTVAVPEVLEAGEDRLVVEWVETADATAEAAERFGRRLAGLHRAGAGGYGAPWPGFIAELPMDNGPAADWPSFYASRRLHPFIRLARDTGRLGADDVGILEEVIGRLPELAGPAEPPARLHGDLWSGNLLWTTGGVVLVDPAAHGGHRETDLAMLALFGAPHLNTILAAYREEAPPSDGWRARVPLHQLHPLLVHVCLYGEPYRDSLLAAAARSLEI
ncbi:fructosamine kinase [Microtetraspora sp. NBRC 13810]|uniref:fructosamine kinase family protein n=1 Tax=Microtetraspora sp. NBRC 13810 TaxID=3030990 RepID=UPI0024A00C1F|nr:fructosamine kinase family protein [Microtetraspora sp. NBRC 13810]GLW06319.1 fructosamine kinase [Microtetraspora sp. NBRC 13810]